MSEVPLYCRVLGEGSFLCERNPFTQTASRACHMVYQGVAAESRCRGTSLIRPPPPPRTNIGP